MSLVLFGEQVCQKLVMDRELIQPTLECIKRICDKVIVTSHNDDQYMNLDIFMLILY